MSDDEAPTPDDEAPTPDDEAPTPDDEAPPSAPRAGRRPGTLGVLVGLALGLVVGLTMGVVVGVTGFTPEEPPPGPLIGSLEPAGTAGSYSRSGPASPSVPTLSGLSSAYGTATVPDALAAPVPATPGGGELVPGLVGTGSYPAGSSSTERAQRLRNALTATGIPTVGSGEFETTLAAGICDRFTHGGVPLAQLARDADAAVDSFDADLARRFVDVAVASYCS